MIDSTVTFYARRLDSARHDDEIPGQGYKHYAAQHVSPRIAPCKPLTSTAVLLQVRHPTQSLQTC